MAKWMISAKRADFDDIAVRFHISPITARLIRNRGAVTDEEIDRYLNGDLTMLHDPTLLPDILRAATLLLETIRAGQTIRIVGDYDVDGVSATAILMRGLSAIGARCDYRIPHRIKDGYGINDAIVEEAKSDGVDLILTCDNGISAREQVALAHKLGMKMIVTDHHDVPVDETTKAQSPPEADAVVDPKIETDGQTTYPFSGVCGAVVAYKLLQVVYALDEESDAAPPEELIELCALATVCDVMELKDENRAIVKEGLRRMKDGGIAGLRALLRVTGLFGKEITVYQLGFVIGPCLNASGRLDSASRCVELLLADDEDAAIATATACRELNESRKEMTRLYLEQAKEIVRARKGAPDKVLVVYLPDAHESVAGIVAGRLKEAYFRPAIVITKSADGVKGSARSVPQYDMFRSLSACADLFTRFGGHPMAAGLSMRSEEDVETLRRRLNDACDLSADDLQPVLHLDMELPPRYATIDLIDEWARLAPFGQGNERPLFAARDVRLKSGRILGKNANVGKYAVEDAQGNRFDLMLFRDLERWHTFLDTRFGEAFRRGLYEKKSPDVDATVKIVYYPDVNEFQGRRTVQLIMEDYD